MALLLRILAGALMFVGGSLFLLQALVMSLSIAFGRFRLEDVLGSGPAETMHNVFYSGLLAGVGGILWAVTRTAYPEESNRKPRWFSPPDEPER